MRVTLNSVSLSAQKPCVFAQKLKNNLAEKSSKVVELANFNSVGRSMVSFNGNDENSNTRKDKSVCINGEIYDFSDLMKKPAKELVELKKYCETKEIELKQKKELTQTNYNKIYHWNDTFEFEKQKSDAKKEIASKGLNNILNPFQCMEIKEEYYTDYLERREEIKKLKDEGTNNKDFIEYLSEQEKYMAETAKLLSELIDEKLDIEEHLLK